MKTPETALHKAIHAVEDLAVVGERRNIGIVPLAVRSRASAQPVNLEVSSPPTTGKTHTVSGALALESLKAYYELTAASEKALIYLEEALEHRTIYFSRSRRAWREASERRLSRA